MSRLVSLPSALGMYVNRDRARGASWTRKGGLLYFDTGGGEAAGANLDEAAASAAAAPMDAAAAGPEAVADAHAGRCVGQCALWHAREQYDTFLQRPHLELAETPEHCAHTELMLTMMRSVNAVRGN